MRIKLANEFGDINWVVYFAITPQELLQGNAVAITVNGQEFRITSDQVSEMLAIYNGVATDYVESASLFQTPNLDIGVRIINSQDQVIHSSSHSLTNWSYIPLLHLPVDESSFGPGFWTLGSADKDLSETVVRDYFGNTFPREWGFIDGKLYQFPGVGENHAGAVDLGFTDGNPGEVMGIYSFCEDCTLIDVNSGERTDDGETWTEYNVIFKLPIRLLDDNPELNGDSIAAQVGHLVDVDPAFLRNYQNGDLVPSGLMVGQIRDRPGVNHDAHTHWGVWDNDQPGDPAYPGDPNFVNIDIVYLVDPNQRVFLNPQEFYDRGYAPLTD